jgi:DNA topoisomerase-6 subunit B
VSKTIDDIEVAKISKAARKKGITASSTAEYFSKNLQQVGFSSPTKAVLTTLKEAVDNSLDACEEHGILPDLGIVVEKLGDGSIKNTEKLRIRVEDNGPGISPDDIAKVFGEYLASSKFGRGRCSRGQQGIGISAATTWALQTTATGARVITKQKNQRKAVSCLVEIDLKNNKGVIKEKDTIDWDRPHGTSVEFTIDGRLQINGEAGLQNYINANVLVNPHMSLRYHLPGMDKAEVLERVSQVTPVIPDSVEPHPHTMKLGEFISHASLFGSSKVSSWLKQGFSRVSDKVIAELIQQKKVPKSIFDMTLGKLNDEGFKSLFVALQGHELMAPSTASVLSIGEEGLSKSIKRIGEIDFFSVVSRKPAICDFKPVQVEVAIARLITKSSEEEDPAHVIRFANRVPLQFDKGGCAIVKAINTVNWRSYGLRQPKNSIPLGPYIVCVSIVSPFIKFKNASKETIDASDELVEEIRRALMQAGQRLSRHIKRENKEAELEEKIQHIERFGPILVETLVRIVGANEKRKDAAEQGLMKLLGRDARTTEKQLEEAEVSLEKQKSRSKYEDDDAGEDDATDDPDDDDDQRSEEDDVEDDSGDAEIPSKKTKKKAKAAAAPKRKAKK